ncbi:conserved hypothetical protein [Culex quinquefasciatus]|uniref:Peptidase S1 domain-containing protein n=1 Tax=Culex quinquefasciatus TaxID=7176 RepID=B0WPS9_CULQU|nr:conserved hypothetical protein [Culex quinquefasciatus]|eukprot:XP_001850713.1 conserved hypothetical protein [Culex quinquefasciatus]
MKCLVPLLFAALFPLVEPSSDIFYADNALFQCGIRKRFGVQLIHHGRTAELGQWPWHAALYHRKDGAQVYKCGGTLIDQRHVLTSAHCVVQRNRMVMNGTDLSVHLGKRDLGELSESVQVMDVSEVHVHPEFSTNRHDLALIVLERVVRFSEFVIPICLEKGRGEGQLEELVGQRGWVAGWGETENGTVSSVLKTASMPVVGNTECVQSDPGLFGRFVSTAMFCASDRNGSSVCRGDSGECQQYAKLAVKQSNGVCYNARSPQTVVLVYEDNTFYCSSFLISERFILTAAHCVTNPNVEELVRVRITAQLDIAILKVHRHPAFSLRSKTPIAHDIAVVELVRPLKLTSRLLPACLANRANENLYDSLLQTGFTGSQFYENPANRVISIERCNLRLQDIARFRLSELAVCATGQLDSADLDGEYDLSSLAGGPLQTVNSRSCMFTAVGVLGSGVKRDRKLLQLYTSVAAYVDWIEQVAFGEEDEEIVEAETSTVTTTMSTAVTASRARSMRRERQTDIGGLENAKRVGLPTLKGVHFGTGVLIAPSIKTFLDKAPLVEVAQAGVLPR